MQGTVTADNRGDTSRVDRKEKKAEHQGRLLQYTSDQMHWVHVSETRLEGTRKMSERAACCCSKAILSCSDNQPVSLQSAHALIHLTSGKMMTDNYLIRLHKCGPLVSLISDWIKWVIFSYKSFRSYCKFGCLRAWERWEMWCSLRLLLRVRGKSFSLVNAWMCVQIYLHLQV